MQPPFPPPPCLWTKQREKVQKLTANMTSQVPLSTHVFDGIENRSNITRHNQQKEDSFSFSSCDFCIRTSVFRAYFTSIGRTLFWSFRKKAFVAITTLVSLLKYDTYHTQDAWYSHELLVSSTTSIVHCQENDESLPKAPPRCRRMRIQAREWRLDRVVHVDAKSAILREQ